MEELFFEWDEFKNIKNYQKHGISFEEALTVFYDNEALCIFDEGNSSDEDRFVIMGMSERNRLLIVCHCLRKEESVIRIISARKATSHENHQYEESITGGIR